MLRVIVREVDNADACHVGGPVRETIKSFEIEVPDLERYLREAEGNGWQYVTRRVIGVETL